jgi:hypothetical protein
MATSLRVTEPVIALGARLVTLAHVSFAGSNQPQVGESTPASIVTGTPGDPTGTTDSTPARPDPAGIAGDATPFPFVVVTTVVLSVLMLGWRLVARAALNRRPA